MTIPTRTFHLLTSLTVVLFVIAGALTLDDYGMGWDEVTRWKSGDLKLEYYQRLLRGDAQELAGRMAGDRYPGLFDLPLAAWHGAFGGDRMLQGHALSLAFGAAGLLATAWLAGIVFGPGTAFLATLLLAVTPHFYGHAMVNPKDIPFMATYTLGLASILAIARDLVRHPQVHWARYLVCGLAVGMAGASRVPGLVLLAIAAVCWTAATLWGARQHQRPLHPARAAARLLSGTAVAGAAALTVVLLFFPRLHFQLLRGLPTVAADLHTSAEAIPLLFAGRVSDAGDAMFGYAHAFMIVSTPLWMLGLLALGFGLLVVRLRDGPGGMIVQHLMQLLLLGVAAFPWLYILVTQPALHNGLRHMLFGLPPLVVLMAHGAERGIALLRGRGAAAAGAGMAVLAGCVLLQVWHLVRMHPYQYVSFNLLAGERATIPNRFEAEYWFTSSRHLLQALPEVAGEAAREGAAAVPVRVRVAGPLQAAQPFLPPGFVLTDSFADADYFVSNTTFRTDLLAEGDEVFRIERGGIPIGVIKRLPPGQ